MALASDAAKAAFASGDFDAAERIYATLLLAQPAPPHAQRVGWMVNRANCLLRTNPPRLDDAVRACQLALRLVPGYGAAHEMLATVYHRMVTGGALWRIYDEVALSPINTIVCGSEMDEGREHVGSPPEWRPRLSRGVYLLDCGCR
jgi:hypothetical protein